MLGHMVYFTLKEQTPEARKTFVDACNRYLSDHPGIVHFSVGTLAEQYQREVNDQNFDVALHLVFESAAAHDEYQSSPRHVQFIAENKDRWAKVRVFDAETA
jgi:hypothetical protein